MTPFYLVYVSQADLNSLLAGSEKAHTLGSSYNNVTEVSSTSNPLATTINSVTESSIHNNSTYYLSRFSFTSELENVKFSFSSFGSFVRDSIYLDYQLGDNFLGNLFVNELQDILYPIQSLFNNTSLLLKDAIKSTFSPLQSLFATNDSSLQSSVHTSRSLSIESAYSYNINGSHELPSDYRFQKTQNPIFKYDFKVGNYMTEAVVKLNRHFFTTVNDTTTGLRVAP